MKISTGIPVARVRTTSRRGFSLVEMLIAVAIIAVLLALTLVAGSQVLRRTDIARTQRTIQVLDLSLSEWAAQADRTLSWGETPTLLEWHDIYGDIPHIFTVTEALRVVARNESAREVLASLDPQVLVLLDPSAPRPIWLDQAANDPNDPDPLSATVTGVFTSGLPNPDGPPRTFEEQFAVLDGWDRPIRMVHPGRVWRRGTDAPADRDEDGTIRTDMERIYGVCQGRQPFFVSAGRSGLFGDQSSGNATERLEAVDNIYSYPVEQRGLN